MQEPRDPLDSLLNKWGDTTPPPPENLSSEVWRRISMADDSPEAASTGWLATIHAAFARPSFSVAFVAACMLLGLFLAEVRRSHVQSHYNTQLMQNYLRLIDPLLDEKPSFVTASAPKL